MKQADSKNGKISGGWREFVLIPDILLIGLLFAAGAAFTVTQLGYGAAWLWWHSG